VQSGNAKIGPEEWAKRLANRTNGQRAVPTQGVRPLDDKSSWMRVLITVAIGWRLVLALVALVLLLLVK
jgi:hypothetical protein